MRQLLYYTTFTHTVYYFGMLTFTFLLAFFVSVTIEAPLMNLEKLIFSPNQSRIFIFIFRFIYSWNLIWFRETTRSSEVNDAPSYGIITWRYHESHFQFELWDFSWAKTTLNRIILYECLLIQMRIKCPVLISIFVPFMHLNDRFKVQVFESLHWTSYRFGHSHQKSIGICFN